MSDPPKPPPPVRYRRDSETPKTRSNLSPVPLLPPPPVFPPDFTSILESIAKNPRDRYYKDETIYLDGYTFTNCCFNNCELITETGVFALRSCMILSNCRFRYGPAAVRVIRLWNVINFNATWPEFNPKVEADGSVTIE